MGFSSLLGNERLKEGLRSSIHKGRISHFYLICGAVGSGRHTLASLLAAAILCQNPDAPCLQCSECRKVLHGTHPDFITVDDPSTKTVTVKLIRTTLETLYIRPNEAQYKIYLFPRAQDMPPTSQNVLLKSLEEPPQHAVFILLTDNPERMLPTVRSRCTELALAPLPDSLISEELSRRFPTVDHRTISEAVAVSGGFLGQAIARVQAGAAVSPRSGQFVDAMAQGDQLALWELLNSLEKQSRDSMQVLFREWCEILEGALVCRAGGTAVNPGSRRLASACTGVQLHDALVNLQHCLIYLQANVSVAAICGYLVWALSGDEDSRRSSAAPWLTDNRP